MSDTALVTGATAGIGYHTAAALARLGWQVLITGRDPDRGALAAARIGATFLPADHATVAGNRDLAARVADRVDRLDVLVNNVGGSPTAARLTTVDGVERTLALNFLGPAILTTALLPLVERRVVTVVSSAHTMWRGDPTNVDGPHTAMGAYAQSKLLSLMWTLALARRVAGTGVTANATNPGAAWTPGTARLTPAEVPQWRFIFPIVTWFRRRASAERAARSTIQLAADPDSATLNGAYVESDGKLARPAPAARRLIDQERTWALAERLAARVPG